MTDPAGFIGREREVVRLARLLNEGRSLALIGPVGIGKSSLLIHLLHAAPVLLERPPETLLIDVRSVQAPAELYRTLLHALGREGDDELTLAQALQAGELLLGLDHLEQAGPGFTRPLRSALRALVGEGKLQLIVASDLPLASVAPDFRDALTEERIGPLPEREARALAEEMLARAEVEASAQEVGRLVAAAGGHPARLRRAAELWLRSNRGADFDWRRALHESYPDPAEVADTVAMADERLAAEASDSGSRLVRRLRERLRPDQDEPQTYEAEDLSAFLLLLVVVSTLLLAAYLPATWPMRLLSVGLVFSILAILLPWIGLRSGWRDSASFRTYLEGLRMMPGMRALLKRLEK